MKKRLLSILLVCVMLVSLLPTFALAAPVYGDTNGHWAADAIDRWSGYGVVSGKGEGSFDPDGQMTRAEAAQVFANLLGLNKEGDISAYPDAQGKWYSEAIAKCVAAGILNGKGAGKMDPNGTVTREEFLTMYARAVCISNGADVAQAKSELEQKGFADTAKVSDWAADSIGTLVEKGYVNGLTATELAPKANINRASVMALLNQSISTYVGKDSTETTVAAKSEGITLIANPTVTTVTGTADVVVVAAGAEQYDETGVKSEIVVDSTASVSKLTVSAEGAKVTVSGKVESVTVAETAKSATVETTSTSTVGTVTIAAESATASVAGKVESVTVAETAKSATVETKANSTVGTLNVAAEDAKTTVAGKVETVKVEETAKNVAVETTSTAKVTTVENKAENTAVTGTGSVGAVKSSEDVKVETKNTKVENTSETKEIAVTDSKGTETKVDSGSTGQTTPSAPTGGGGGGDSHSHTYANEWTYDETNHWHAATCSHKDEKSGLAAHNYDETTHRCECGAFESTMVAAIGDQGYTTLEAAVAAAVEDDTVKLLKNVTLTERVDTAFTGTVDLNGHTVSSTETCANGSVFNVKSGTVSIKNGTMIGIAGPTGLAAPYENECDVITVRNGATANLDELDISINCRTGACIYAFDGGRVNVKGGTYSNAAVEYDENKTTKAMLLNQADGKEQAIFVTGGTFRGENPANGDNSGTPTTFVAPGYGVKDNGDGTWTITEPVAQIDDTKYATLAAAVDAATNGQTVVLLRDCSGIGIKVNKSLTFDFNGHSYTADTEPTGSEGTKNQAFQLLNESGSVTFKNGAIYANNNEIKLLIQNYCDLTLQNMTLDATKGSNIVTYVLSNNCGTVNITGNTSITAKDDGYAFDAYYWPAGADAYKAGVTVKVNTTGTIKGIIELDADSAYETYKNTVNISNGNFVGGFNVVKGNLSITGGTFSSDPSKYVAMPYYAVQSDDVWIVKQGKWYVKSVEKDTNPVTSVAEETGTVTWASTENANVTVTETVRYLTVQNVGSQTTNTTFDLYCGKTCVKSGATFANCANGSETWLGRTIIKFPAGNFYDQGDSYLNSSAIFMIGEVDGNNKPATNYLANGSGCVSYKGLQFQNRESNTPLRTFYVENFVFDGSNQQNKWGHLITMTCYGIDAEFVNVKFSNMTQDSRTSVLGIWANDKRTDESYPTVADNVGVDVRFTNCTVVNCNSKPVIQCQTFAPGVVSANPDCYSYISVVADSASMTNCGLNADNYAAFCTQNNNNLHDGVHSDWTLNGETVTVPGQVTSYN